MESKKLDLIKSFATWFKSQSAATKALILIMIVAATLIYDVSPMDLLPLLPFDDIAVTGFSTYLLYQMLFGK